MTESYDEFVEDIKRHKNFVSLFNTDTQKMVALYMWRYVRDHLDELHNMLTDEEIEWGDNDYGYDAVDKIKENFCAEFENDTGLIINWCNNCILCHHLSNLAYVSNPCANCPLKSCDARSENPYHTLVEYAFHKKSKNDALSAIDTIIRTIKGAKL